MRVRRGLTQEQLAANSGLERSYTGGIERGVRNPTIITLLKIAVALDCKPGELLEGMNLPEEANGP